MRGKLSLLLIAVAVAACAGGREPVRLDEDGRVIPEAPRMAFFISPHGEPFQEFRGGSPIDTWFEGADADSDQRLTEAEFIEDARRFFAEIDADGNGYATSPEVSALRQARAQQLETIVAARGSVEPRQARNRFWSPQTGFVEERGPLPPRRVPVLALLDEREPVLASDSDFNRLVSLDEFLAAARERFRMLDANNRGVLTIGDLRGRQRRV